MTVNVDCVDIPLPPTGPWLLVFVIVMVVLDTTMIDRLVVAVVMEAGLGPEYDADAEDMYGRPEGVWELEISVSCVTEEDELEGLTTTVTVLVEDMLPLFNIGDWDCAEDKG